MPRIPIIMPQLGESIAEATIVSISAQPGETVNADQEILEVETNKAVMTVTSPCGGTIENWVIQPQQSYAVGAVLGFLETTDEEAARAGLDTPSQSQVADESAESDDHETSEPATATTAPRKGTVAPTVRGLPVPAHASGASYLSPRMRARMADLGLHAADLAGVAGSGSAGRVTIEDFEKFVSQLEQNKMTPASTMRVAVADAMRRSWTRPIATVALPINLDPVLAHRKAQEPKPGPALYALRALALALAENSALAGRLVGNRIVHPRAIDVGFAVEVEDGVLVPVMRAVDTIPLAELTPKYNELVEQARQRRLPPTATGGSIATITNFGTFGLTWATPIPLPEQTLVLGLGAGRLQPHWDAKSEKFLPVMEANMTLSFDHRVLDGGGAGRLLARIAALLADPEKL